MSYKLDYPTRHDIRWSRAVELPSMQEIQEMDRQRQQAIESLEISADGCYVKCQRCKTDIRKPPTTTSPPKSARIDSLRYQIQWISQHPNYYHRSNANRDELIRAVQAELTELEEEEAKADKLRDIPLYSSKITGFKFYCGQCFDKLYMRVSAKMNERTNELHHS
jgi:hypothetical protein